MSNSTVTSWNDSESKVVFFRPRKPGPELWLEDAVAANATSLVSAERDVWLGASFSMGMTRPDITIVSYDPMVSTMARLTHLQREALTYLRAVTRVRIDTVASRLQRRVEEIATDLSALLKRGLVAEDGNCISAVRLRCLPLREVVTVEAKVDKWRIAVQQAGRNSMVATRSYVALPRQTALRVRSEPTFSQLGIGILAVASNGNVTVIRRPRRREPTVWRYYYDLATSVGDSVERGQLG